MYIYAYLSVSAVNKCYSTMLWYNASVTHCVTSLSPYFPLLLINWSALERTGAHARHHNFLIQFRFSCPNMLLSFMRFSPDKLGVNLCARAALMRRFNAPLYNFSIQISNSCLRSFPPRIFLRSIKSGNLRRISR